MENKKMNLLYVFADQWRRGAMGCAQDDPVLTPRMDEFAKEGVRCTACTSTFPLCSPHRACLLTGKYPQSVGFFTNCKTGIPLRLQDSEYGMGDIFKDNGYETAYIGKWHLDEPDMNHSDNPESGAREWDAFTPPGVRRHGFDFWYSYGADDHHEHPHYWKDTPEMIKVDQWSPEHETDVAIKWLEEQRDPNKPFAAVISWNPPHPPYEMIPDKYMDIYRDMELPIKENVDFENLHGHTHEDFRRSKDEMIWTMKQYYAAVSGLDVQFGRLLDALKRLGLEENTLVVLSADHGDSMGSHGLIGKHSWYEESIGIPFVAKGPGVGQGVCDSVFGSQDQLPTLLGMMGLKVPDTIEGIDCSEDILNAHTDEEKASFIYACPGKFNVIQEFAEHGKTTLGAGWRGIRTNRYVYVIDAGYEVEPKMQRLLYDLKEDPLQMHPTVVQPGENEVADRLEQRVCQWLRNMDDPFYSEHLC